MTDQEKDSRGASCGSLEGLRVLDLSRILAGPTCTQLLGDLGADVIKVEKPGAGDDTRKWGPPFLTGRDGMDTLQSTYFACANRNKRSIEADISTVQGRAVIDHLLTHSDVLVENFKVGDLARHGLSYQQLRERYPRLIYCSITGFGQDGPYAERAGYDFLVQGMGGIMSLNGVPTGEPQKVAVGISDLMTGMYAAVAILAALRHRDKHHEGQHIDLALLDCQVAWLANAATHFLGSGESPQRLGNGHPNIVPYDLVPASDGNFILAVGNDQQFARFCDLVDSPHWATDPKFSSNRGRVVNRDLLMPMIKTVTAQKSCKFWLRELESLGIPAGPINSVVEVFNDPQVLHRGMKIQMRDDAYAAGVINLVGNPIHMSRTPPTYRFAPPASGQHTAEVFREFSIEQPCPN